MPLPSPPETGARNGIISRSPPSRFPCMSSTASTLILWVKMPQLDSGISGAELPADFAGLLVTLDIPIRQLPIQCHRVGDASVQALPRQKAQLDLGDVQPTAVARRIGDVQPTC